MRGINNLNIILVLLEKRDERNSTKVEKCLVTVYRVRRLLQGKCYCV